MSTTQKPPKITMEEQEKILVIAESMIRDPKFWTTGSWKCPLYETDARGVYLCDEHGEMIQATDSNGQGLYMRCIEGAVNEATFQVLGEKRALKLGAFTYDEHGEMDFGGAHDVVELDPAKLLGLDALAWELYAETTALEYNDSPEEEPEDEDDRRSRDEVHEGVLTILRTRLKHVRAKLEARRAA